MQKNNPTVLPNLTITFLLGSDSLNVEIVCLFVHSIAGKNKTREKQPVPFSFLYSLPYFVHIRGQTPCFTHFGHMIFDSLSIGDSSGISFHFTESYRGSQILASNFSSKSPPTTRYVSFKQSISIVHSIFLKFEKSIPSQIPFA
jgi:hypothetical protein